MVVLDKKGLDLVENNVFLPAYLSLENVFCRIVQSLVPMKNSENPEVEATDVIFRKQSILWFMTTKAYTKWLRSTRLLAYVSIEDYLSYEISWFHFIPRLRIILSVSYGKIPRCI